MVRAGKQRLYIRPDYRRRSVPSENELAARQRFAEIAARIRALSEQQLQEYEQDWRNARFKFNGKKYATLRGYIMARLFKEGA